MEGIFETEQGLSMGMNNKNSFWTFSFLKNPELIEKFVEEFQLIPIE